MDILKNSKKKNILSLFIALFLLFWNFPIYSDGLADVIAKSGFLDGSWKIGLNWANLKGLHFGKDIVFTYGPLYFLSDNTLLNFNRGLYFWANFLCVILYFCSVFLLAKFIIDRLDFSEPRYKIFSHIVILLSLYSFLNVYIEIPEILLLLSFLILFSLINENYNKRSNVLWSIAVGFIFAILSLCKLYYLTESLVIIFVSIIIFIIIKRSYILISLIGSFFIFLFSIWLILEKSIISIFNYIKGGFAITFGFSESCQLYFEDWQGKFYYEGKFIIFYAILIFILWSIFFIYGAAKKSKETAFYFLLSFPIIFLVFKQGFTRMDHFHTQEYFRFIVFILIFTFLIFCKKYLKLIPIFLIIIMLAIPFRTVDEPLSIRRKISYNLNEINKVIKIINKVSYQNLQLKEKEQVKNLLVDYEDVVNKINKNDTVEIIPFEIVVPFVYDLNWDPRPIFMSINVYNSILNELNGNHFTWENGPSKVIYKINSVDGRYPLFDEPLVFQELLKNYNFIYSNNKGIGLLEKKKEKADYIVKSISNSEEKFGETINVPDINDGYLFCKINIDLNIFGKIKNLFYKGDYIKLKFNFKDPSEQPIIARIVRENGKQGFFIANYVGDINQLKEIFNQSTIYKIEKNKIKSIEIITDNKTNFINNFNVEFYELKLP